MTSKRIKHRRSTPGKRDDDGVQSRRSSRSGSTKLSTRRARPTTPGPTPDQTPAEAGMVRVSKLMSARGLCSRREADYYIEQGWVYVDDVKIEALGTRVHESQHIRLSKVAEKRQQRRVTVLLHKPLGFVSGQPEKGYTAAASLVKPSNYIQFRGSQEKPRPA